MARKFATPETANRSFHPPKQMDAIGDISDGHFVDRLVGIKGMPHMAADATMQLADAVGGAGEFKGKHRHAERCLNILRVHPAELHNLLKRSRHLTAKPLHGVIHQVRAETVMPSFDGSVRGEDARSARFGESVLVALSRSHFFSN